MVIYFHRWGSVERKEDQAELGPDPDEEEVEDVRLDNERECHWRMVSEDNDGGVDNRISIMHDER